MPGSYRGKFSVRATKKKRSTRRKKSTRVSKTVKRYVKKAVHAAVENKIYMNDLVGAVTGDNNLILTPSSSTLPQYFSLIPAINQGTGVMSRTGNKCRVMRHTLRIQLLLSGAAITAAVDVPMNIYYFVLYARDSPSTLGAADLNQLFYYSSAGTASTTQFLSGSGFATTHRLNTDYFNILKTNYPNRPIKLGYSQYSSGGVYSNNDYKSNMHFDIDLTKHTPKLMHFSNTTSSPLNLNMYVCFYVQKQSLDVTITNWDPPQLYANQIISYEDA